MIADSLSRDYNCDSTTIRLRRIMRACFRSTQAKMNMSVFRLSRIAVELNANHNFILFRCNWVRRGIVIS